MSEVSRPVTFEEFHRLGLEQLWAAVEETVDAGWALDVEVLISSEQVTTVWVQFSDAANRRKLPRIIGLGRIMEVLARRGVELDLSIHCGCGECKESQWGVKVFPKW